MSDTLFPMPADPIRHKLFFAAIPPEDVAEALARVWRDQGTGARFRADKLHLTLHYAAGLPRDDPPTVAALMRAGDALSAAPFTLLFDRLTPFAGRVDNRALVAVAGDPQGQAQAVTDQLRLRCAAEGLRAPRAQRLIRPHVTLAYGRGFQPDRPIPDPIRWSVKEIVLIDSHQGQRRHEHLVRWPLGDA